MSIKRTLLATSTAVVCTGYLLLSSTPHAAAPDPRPVLVTYADIAQAGYADSLASAERMARAIRQFLAVPSAEGLSTARKAWVAAREPYQQTEVYRFGNAVVDEWEGKVNAWPLDEGLIDYVAASYGAESEENAFYAVNIIANPELNVAGRTIDARRITPGLLRSLHEIDDVESNVAVGYHAIEFLLWGQDLNGTGPGAGNRPWTDFDVGSACTGGHCARRGDYLDAVTQLLLSDLKEIVAAWSSGGAAREILANGPPENGIAAILTGMGSLSYGELAGERMRLGLMLHDPEEEHDCFSDNTHNSHYFDALGIQNVYLGRYRSTSGRLVSGPSLSDLVKAASSEVDDDLRAKLTATMSAMTTLRDRAENKGIAYDQMIGENNPVGNAIVQAAVDALVAQTRSIERAAGVLGVDGLQLSGSDSLDNPSAVFK